jgi:DNA-binding response OmpR family regulator
MLQGLHVVVAEDDFLIAQHLEDVLVEQGAETTMVSSVSELLSMDLGATNVAILDRSLSDGDVEMGAARLADAGIPLIYQTGRDVAEMGGRSRAIGILSKPVNEGELLRLLASVKDAHAA